MNPEFLKLIATLIPALVEGIKDGADIIQRIQAGDETAVAQAKEWLGITDEVANAIANWEASKTITSL